MSRIFLLLTLLCTYALASVPEDTKQKKRGVALGNDGWIGLPNPYGYGHGHPWTSVDHTPWKGLKLPEVNLHAGLYPADAFPYGRGGIALAHGLLKTLPVYITKHVVLEKPVPVPEPVIIEKPYHVPVEKVIPVPIEKIIHKPVPVPVPVPQAVPIPVEHPVPIPIKQPIAVPVQQPYPIAVKHPVPVPVPIHVPVPFPVHPPSHLPPPLPLPLPLPINGHPGAIYGPGFAPNHLYAPLHFHPPVAIATGHSDHAVAHGFIGHGLDHMLAHGYGHGYGYGYDLPSSHHDADHLVHAHEHKKRKTEKN